MDVEIQRLISDRLETLKSRGWVSEYLIAWRGHGGRLEPNVTVWARVAPHEALEVELKWLVGDLVRSSDLTVLPAEICQTVPAFAVTDKVLADGRAV
jgi:hypothetical protein